MTATRMMIRLRCTTTPGRYAAMLGDRELCRSRQPFLDAARVLLGEGVRPSMVLEARHEGSAIVVGRATVGEAASRAEEPPSQKMAAEGPWKAPEMPQGERSAETNPRGPPK